jgi:energy-coupling factor transport system permease protein
MIAVTALVSELSGGEGLPYLIRMIPILLVAMWAYSDRNEGELLDVSVWMFGKGIGFDMGLMAEMGMQSLSQIAHDLSRIRQAMIIKGMKPSIRVIIPMATNIVVNQLRRAEGIAKLLRVRGYRGGGELKPRFMTERRDMVLTISAMIVLVLAILGYY